MTKVLGCCAALDLKGKRCRKTKGLKPVNYHGDHEIYGTFSYGREPQWVRVWLCKDHREDS